MEQRRKQQRAKAIEFEGKNDYHNKFSIAASVTPHSLLCGLNPARKYVIPACFYPSIFLGTVRFPNRRESRRNPYWTPDPFGLAQGRGEHSRTTIKTFGGDSSWKYSLNVF